MGNIIDNSNDNLLVTHVNKLLDTSEFSRMAVGYFYLSGFEAIREKLSRIKHLKLIIGNRTNQQTLEELVKGHVSRDLSKNELRKQRVHNAGQKEEMLKLTQDEYSEDLSLMEQNETNEKGLSALWELIRDNKIDIRVYNKGTLHSKAYLFDLPEKDYLEGIAIVGSSNLSISGLSNNSELNIKIAGENDYKEVKQWFDNLWNECEDFNELFMNSIQESWFQKKVSPYDIYIKTLYHLVKDRIEIKEYSALTGFNQENLYPFQRDAYNRALDILENKDNPQNGVFISDVVGLGKSYIAIALISYYWSIRQKSALIVCPASLKKMWEDYKDEFHLRCKIIASSSLTFKDGNENYTLNDEPEFDGYGVVIIDESHNFRNPENQKYKVLAPYLQGKKVILLTATPQNNSVWDVFYQVKLFHQSDITALNISPNNIRSFFKENEFNLEKIAELLQNFLIRRTRKDILTSPRYKNLNITFPERKLHTLEYDIDKTYSSQGRISIYDSIIEKLFNEKVEKRYKYTIYDLTAYLKKEAIKKPAYIGLSNLGELVRGLLKVLLFKRLESSVASFYKSVERMIKRNEYILKSIEKGFVITGDVEQLQLFLDNKDNEQDDGKVNKYSIDDFEVNQLVRAINADKDILKEVLELVKPIYDNIQKDTKFQTFINEVIEKYKDEKILVFSEFSDTVNYIHKELSQRYPDIVINRISSLVANSQEKANIIRRFSPNSQTHAGLASHEKEIQFLITTDVLSEGQNLQDARVLVNYDFHWNPVRLIQRIGRIDRIGSKAKEIEVYNFMPDNKIEHQLDLKARVEYRINEIKRIFGDSGQILSEEEILNEHSVFSIYSDKDDSVLEADDSITTIFDKAENTLLKLKNENPKEYDRIINLKDGIRTACNSHNKGTFAYLTSGNLHRLYYATPDKINEKISEVLTMIEATPTNPKPVEFSKGNHNSDLKGIYDYFKEELLKRQKEIESNQITSEQRYFVDRLKNVFDLFNQTSFMQRKVDELFEIYSNEIPDYAKSQLRRLRRENPPDEILIENLQRLVETARIKNFQEKEKESERMIVRTICSEGFH